MLKDNKVLTTVLGTGCFDFVQIVANTMMKVGVP